MCSSLGIHHEPSVGNRKSVPTRSVVTTQAGQRAPVIQRIRRAHARRANRRPPPKLQRRPLPPPARWHRTTCDVCANRRGREARPDCSRPTRAAGSSTRGVRGSGGPLAARVCAPHPRLALEGQLSTTRSEPSGTTLNRGPCRPPTSADPEHRSRSTVTSAQPAPMIVDPSAARARG